MKPLILVSNDDGINATGLKSLVEALLPVGNIFVVAPDGGRSGQSCAITAMLPIRAKLMKESERLTIYKCTGTPVDCVKLALGNLVPRKPDLIVSGINHGSNSSISVHYSGTMAVAIEGAFNGVPSVGFSLCSHDPDADFTSAAEYARLISEKILKEGLPEGICLNVNIPCDVPMNGIKICRQAKAVWSEEFEKRTDPHGHEYYWLTGFLKNKEPETEDTDEYALSHGYISIVPCKIDFTAVELFPQLKKWENLLSFFCNNNIYSGNGNHNNNNVNIHK
ncbi:MAG: 5'/3'-nucleotidase SurE [Candidatus Azobacteroides sp.]|nr:5'/3'-nucleotidase SurE [Candidatus Azobacteroides sp.]